MPDDPITLLLMYALIPLWIVAGLADWLCHRSAGIEHNAGPKESLIHLLMFGQIGVGLMTALVCEVNALVIVMMVVIFLLHEATALWDVSYAVSKRVVTPLEQHVHSFLEMIPLMAIGLLAVSHWDQVRALVGASGGPPDFSLRLKDPPVSGKYLAAVVSAAFLFSLLPYGLELWRGLRARHSNQAM
ncbi:MAG TPA: diguanylate cyclase [Candidatus Aquabacterium excrementipullorum]|nr:diguanylate cyclase [Candidatus Aquabacterium excrementipullorum]